MQLVHYGPQCSLLQFHHVRRDLHTWGLMKLPVAIDVCLVAAMHHASCLFFTHQERCHYFMQ